MSGAWSAAAAAQPARAPGPAARPRVAVCVATCLRPRGLARLLDSLAELRVEGEADPFLVVVDNDAAGSARAVVDAAPLPFPVLYAVEPERNIALARNRSVEMALRNGADWVAFVDDDETVSADWLAELLRTRQAHAADVVAGGVLPVWPDGTAPWLEQGLFYGALVPRDPTRLTVANTNNVLVDARLLRDVAGPFDPAFGITGGSDSHLFTRLHLDGARMVYARNALTYESIPESRARAGWVLRRAFRVGITAVRCERTLPGGRPVARLGRAGLHLAYGVATLPLAAVRGRGQAMRSLWSVVYAMGACAGMLGIKYREYQQLHGE